MTLDELAYAIRNHIFDVLKGAQVNFSIEQLKAEIKLERNYLIKQYALNHTPLKKQLQQTISCVKIDCEELSKCCTTGMDVTRHFIIPKLSAAFDNSSIMYIGTANKLMPYKVYTDNSFIYQRYAKYGAKEPYVWIDLSPNKDNKLDCYLFNNDLLKVITVTAIWEDPEDLLSYDCCNGSYTNAEFLQKDIMDRLTEKYIRYYRQLNHPPVPNTQTDA